MQKRIGRAVALFSAMAVGCTLLVQCTCSFAQSERPKEGSIAFGARERPKINGTAGLAGFRSVFADVAEEVVPFVVSVVPTKIDTVKFYRNPFYRFFRDEERGRSPFDFFFNPPEGGSGEPSIEKRERRIRGLGSGVIVSRDGYVLTNYHVVSGADEIEVRLNDKREFEAAIVGSDSLSDVAVLKIDGVDDLPTAYLGDSEQLRPGDWVVAVGNPFSLTWTVTAGIVSGLGRSVSISPNKYQDFIQTDAAINPGNSGGALVNIEGELVGINTMIYSRTGGNMGIGFAIPISMARRVMEDLIYEGEVTRGWIGVSIQNLTGSAREAMGLEDVGGGVLIGDVFEGQPADKAGMQQGDVVLSIGGKEVEEVNELRNVVAALKPGEEVPVEIVRDGEKKTLSVEITRRDTGEIPQLSRQEEQVPSEEGEQSPEGIDRLGVEVKNITPSLRSEMGIPDDVEGVVVVGVDEGSPASRGLRRGDVIQMVKTAESGRETVTNVRQFTKAVKGLESGDSVMLLVNRQGSTHFVAFELR